MNHLLQHIITPSTEFSVPDEMYVRYANDKVTPRFENRTLVFRNTGHATFDTFFNGLTIHAWKKHTNVNHLGFQISGEGRFLIRFGVHRRHHAHRWMQESAVTLTLGETCHIELPFWSKLEAGMLYFTLTAIGAASFESAQFVTSEAPANKVKLGIVITHFNRKAYVVPAMKRIQTQLLDDPNYAGKVSLIVVDNSQNITPEEAHGATVIPNLNLGGSGGFTRGLLHLKDEGSFTHCLFMDDDASCETESIRRTHAFLSYAKTPKFAVAGSMLREIEPNRLFEKGAKFDGMCRPIKSGLDMNLLEDLLIADLDDIAPDYGAWWFFAFNISDAKRFAFPFFVRGDDILFGKMNEFAILTQNGITTWGDDFALKSGPLPIYLDVRNHLLQSLGFLNKKRLSQFKIMLQFFAAQLFSYNYATAKSVILAINHVQEGPEFWIKNMDTSEVRKKIAAYSGSEKLQKISKYDYALTYKSYEESRFRKFLRILTLNGFLLPGFMLSNKTVFQHKKFQANLSEVFRAKNIYYEYEPNGVGYVVTHDKKMFLKLVYDFAISSMSYIFNYKKIKNSYNEKLVHMTSEGFWRNVYKLPILENND